MKTLFSFLLSISFFTSFAQQPFNYQRDFQTILARTKDVNDSLYYDKLMARYHKNDSSLSKYAMLALLIGFTDKPAYQPYKYIKVEEAIFNLNQAAKYKDAIGMATAYLQTNPLSMQALQEKAFAFSVLGEQDSMGLYYSLLNKITTAMLATGNGKSPETARFALGPKDGEHLLHDSRINIAATSSGYDKNGNFLDIVEAKLEFGATVPYYFIIQHARAKQYEGFSKEEIKKMQKESDKKK